MERKRLRLVLLAVAVAASLLAMPAVAHAAVRPSFVTSDTWEPDDTSATAKAVPATMPETSDHSMSGRIGENGEVLSLDQDWAKFSIDETGAPIFVEAIYRSGWFVPSMTLFYDDPVSGLTAVGAGAPVWGPQAFGLQTTIYQRALATGTYYLRIAQMQPGLVGGYRLTIRTGKLSRRIAGVDRFATAAGVSQLMRPYADESGIIQLLNIEPSANLFTPGGVVLCTARDFPDALAAGAWATWGAGDSPLGPSSAGTVKASTIAPPSPRWPILFTDRDTLNPTTAAEIVRLASARRNGALPFTVHVIGGPATISDNVLTQVKELGEGDGVDGVQVERVAGQTRFETAVSIASREASMPAGLADTVFIVNGYRFPDALVAGPVAGHERWPILLTWQSQLHPAVKLWLAQHTEVKYAIIVGGETAVSSDVEKQLEDAGLTVDRVAGASRYETSLKMAEYAVDNGFLFPSGVLVAGDRFADALAGVGLTANTHGPILLTTPTRLSSQVASFYAEYPVIETFPRYIVGGTDAVSTSTAKTFDELWHRYNVIP